MTVDEVHSRVFRMRTSIDDNEVLHLEEDRIWEEVLRSITALGGEAGALALAALETKDIKFARWYA